MVSHRTDRPVLPATLVGILVVLVAVTAGCLYDPPEVHTARPSAEAVPVEVRVLGDGDPERPVVDARVLLLHPGVRTPPVVSDEDGIARFWVTTRGHESFDVKVLKEGWTEETVENAVRVASGSSLVVERDVTVYHAFLSFTETHHWEGPATVQMVGDRTSVEHELAFSDQADLRDAYAVRIDTVKVWLEWENTLTSRADFGVFIRGNRDVEEEERTARSDVETGLLHQGIAREAVTVDRDWFIHAVDPRDPQAAYGIDTEEPVVAPEGVPVEVTVEATFRTPVIEVGEAPIVGPWLLVVALAIGVFARRGRPTA